ncbi:TRAP transporter small permease subunit [Agarivorans aestuarii]|jgi:TRAP-type mannitol/chloroaromatic compound transport system permease small subunit|uniref:TRAP transporter small permease protein n=1 Tax=Agarivorans aestuarii TaxID=1563703 RepID=A0ABU7G5F4_9ALTE|nr:MULTISPECIES: TRAP transporter small permease subunit [Agarivorans]MEE1674628.1 TRAP transporter small permease subunit [Agarivorans aestuarii]
MLRLQRAVDGFSKGIAGLTAVLMLLMLVNIFYDVVMRYFFRSSSIGMQELEWHLFAAMFLLGIASTLQAEGHVRVDIIYDKLSARKRAWIDSLGVVFFLFPFCGLIAWYGYDFALESYNLGETSGDPGGLPYRWIIKSMIPISAICLAISGLGMLLKNLIQLRNNA